MLIIRQNPVPFDLSISDTTVYVGPGTAQVGLNVMSYTGGATTFNQMTSFDTSVSVYQYSALMLQNFYNWPDLTSVPSAPSALADLHFPTIDAQATYATTPIGLFLFNKDATGTINVVSYDKVA